MNDRMQELKLSDLKEKLENRKSGERLVFRDVQLGKRRFKRNGFK